MKLDRPRARLERAQVHAREFGRIWNDFLTGGEAVADDARVIEAAAMQHQPYATRVTVGPYGEGVLEVEPVDFPGESRRRPRGHR